VLLVAGVLVALLDALLALAIGFTVRGTASPTRLFQSIAAGVLGPASYEGGWRSAMLGAMLHLAIACAWAAVFALALRRSAPLRARVRTTSGALGVGAGYGPFVWLVMSVVIVPLSNARPTPPFSGIWWAILVGHVFAVGWPIVFTLRPARLAAPVRTPSLAAR
jgi:ascorbate-specific PTS system EIIC-type component UlaA